MIASLSITLTPPYSMYYDASACHTHARHFHRTFVLMHSSSQSQTHSRANTRHNTLSPLHDEQLSVVCVFRKRDNISLTAGGAHAHVLSSSSSTTSVVVSQEYYEAGRMLIRKTRTTYVHTVAYSQRKHMHTHTRTQTHGHLEISVRLRRFM